MTNLNRADQKGGELREIESALTKGFLFASVMVVIHSVFFFNQVLIWSFSKTETKSGKYYFCFHFILFSSNT